MEAYWIYTNRPEKSRMYIFRKKFVANGEVMKFKISANSRYRLYINNDFVCEGPCKTDELHKCYEESEIKLKVGENVLCVHVMYIKDDFFSVLSGDEPSLWFEGRFGNTNIVSDESFEVACDVSRTLVSPDMAGAFIHPSEIFNPALEPEFEKARILYRPNDNFFTSAGILDRYFMRKRSIPFLKYGSKKNFNVVKSDCELNGEFSRCELEGDFFIDFDLMQYETYFPEITFVANPGATLKLTYSECYYSKTYNENETCSFGEKTDRADSSGELRGYSDVIVSDGSQITFSPFWFRSGRYIRLDGTGIENIKIIGFTFRTYHYNLNIINDFKCSDATYNKMWDVSLNTLKCCMQETYVDCPYYEQQQYLMDTALDMLYTFSISDERDFIKKSINEMSAPAGPERLPYANGPSREKQIIPGFGAFFIYMLKNYILYTGDKAFVAKYVGVVENILAFFESKLTDDGIVGPTSYWPYVDWGKGWDTGVPGNDFDKPLTYYSLLYSNALKWAEYIYESIDRAGTASDINNKRELLNKAINRHCFNGELYSDNPHGNTFSQHCQIFAILGDVCEEPEKLFGSMQNADITECSFSMSFFVLRAYEKLGQYHLADKLYDKWRIMLGNNMTTWGESYEFPRSECHAWSSVMLYEFTSVVLGIKPVENGFKKVCINPYVGNLTKASGRIYTPYGEVEVSFEKADDGIHLTVDSPVEIVKVIDNVEYNDEHIEIELYGHDRIC